MASPWSQSSSRSNGKRSPWKIAKDTGRTITRAGQRPMYEHIRYTIDSEKFYVHADSPLFETWIREKSDAIRCIVSDSFMENRRLRDGYSHHHVTIINAKELRSWIDWQKQMGDVRAYNLVNEIIDYALNNVSVADIRCIGIGRQQCFGNECYFLIIEWPSVMRLREHFGFATPIDLHITLGFSSSDIHGYPKDARTMVHEFRRPMAFDVRSASRSSKPRREMHPYRTK